jgi:DNA-binding XRE family transcriptional regulator
MRKETRFGKKVRDFRLDRGWSQDQLAEVGGVVTRTVQRVEKDQTRDGETLIRCKGLNGDLSNHSAIVADFGLIARMSSRYLFLLSCSSRSPTNSRSRIEETLRATTTHSSSVRL